MDGTIIGAADPITRQMFDDTISALRGSINDLRGVVDSLAKQIGETQSHQQKVLDQLAEERRMREGAISKIEQDVQQIGIRQDKRLHEMDGKLDRLTGGMERISGTLENFGQVLEVRDQATRENLERIKKLENGHEAQEKSLALVTMNQASITQDLRAVTATIYGNKDLPDAPESLMKQVNEIRIDVRSGFAGQAGQIEALRADQATYQERVMRIEALQEAQARKWADRREALVEFAKGLAKSRYFWSVMGLAMAGLITALVPETKDIILQVLVAFLGGEGG